MPVTRSVKEAVKFREETFPLLLLANAKGYRDDWAFRLTPSGFPKIDVIVTIDSGTFPMQITAADPIWLDPNGMPTNGGYDERLVREALNKDGVVHGLAAMRRGRGDIVSDKPVKSYGETFEACVRGIETALQKKVGSGSKEIRLLVYARGYCIHAIDFPFARVIEKAFELIGHGTLRAAFGGYFFVDEDPRIYFELPPST